MEDKKMKKIMFLCLIALFALVLTSCMDDNDYYPLGDYVVTTATIEVQSISPYVIVTDGGDRLKPTASLVPNFNFRDGQRVWVSYTVLGDAENETGDIKHYVRVNDFAEILTKEIFELSFEKEDSIGNDPVRIKGYWFTGDYLTVRFTYSGGGAMHFINLVRNENNLYTGKGMPILEFRHNRNHDLYNYEMWGTASFDVSKLKVGGKDSVQFVLQAKSPGSEMPYEKVITYKYGY